MNGDALKLALLFAQSALFSLVSGLFTGCVTLRTSCPSMEPAQLDNAQLASAEVARRFAEALWEQDFALADRMRATGMPHTVTWAEGLWREHLENLGAPVGPVQVLAVGAGRLGPRPLADVHLVIPFSQGCRTVRVSVRNGVAVEQLSVLAGPEARSSRLWREGAWREETLTLGGIPAVLAVPRAPTKAVAILVPGAGLFDEDGWVGATPVYRDLSRALASRGVAMVRYRKPTFAMGAEEKASVTPAEEIVDPAVTVAGALNALKPDFGQVFFIGHNLGAAFFSQILNRFSAAGVALLGPPADLGRFEMRRMLTEARRTLGLQGEELAAIEENLRAEVEKTRDATRLHPFGATLGRQNPYWKWVIEHGDTSFPARRTPRPPLLVCGSADAWSEPADCATWSVRLKNWRSDLVVSVYPGLSVRTLTLDTHRAEEGPAWVAVELADELAAWILGGASPR